MGRQQLKLLFIPFNLFHSAGEKNDSLQLTMPFAYWRRKTEEQEATAKVNGKLGDEMGKKKEKEKETKTEEKLVEHLLATFPSKRNQRLIETLKARRSQFQVFYPAKYSGEGGEDDDDGDEARDVKRETLAPASTGSFKGQTTGINRIRFQRSPTLESGLSTSPMKTSQANSNFRVSRAQSALSRSNTSTLLKGRRGMNT